MKFMYEVKNKGDAKPDFRDVIEVNVEIGGSGRSWSRLTDHLQDAILEFYDGADVTLTYVFDQEN